MNTANLKHLQTSLARIDDLIHMAVLRAQELGHNPGDALRGLVISWEEVQNTVEQDPMTGFWEEDAKLDISTLYPPENIDPDLPFLQLVNDFELTALDAYIFLLCLAPELDRRYERLYGFLQDDTSKRHVSVGLLMNLLGVTVDQRFKVWERLRPEMPLLNYRLLVPMPPADNNRGASLGQIFHVESRVVSYLLGYHDPDERIRQAVVELHDDPVVALPAETMALLNNAFDQCPIVFLKGRPELGQRDTVQVLCENNHLPVLIFDCAKLRALEIPFQHMWRIVIREAMLNHAALMLDRWEYLLNEDTQPDRDFWHAIYHYPFPVFIGAEKDWEPLDVKRERRILRTAFDVPTYPERRATWGTYTKQNDIFVSSEILDELSNKFRLSREQIARTIATAVDMAASHGREVGVNELYAGIQAHISLQLGHLADRITPRYSWPDLILPPDQLEQLHEITDRARFAYRVQHEWGFNTRIANANGVSALFAGDSGTGKTLAVQVIANELGLALYRIDLSAVVSKYIGETEKNLSKIFLEARASNAILFFDEADAIFGKRSEVKDARDRYANIEVAYLLQQIEDYDGVAIMATNLRQNLDDAFTRRIDFMVDFPFPDADYRQRLWEVHFPPEAPLDPNVNLWELAQRYHLAGGNIRNAALASAYLAAADGGVIRWEHVRSAIRREHQKMGRLVEEF